MKVCDQSYKDYKGNLLPCAREYNGADCPNKPEHIRPRVTGHCGIKCCEGTAPKNFRGTALPTCKDWKYCPCSCHKLIDQMYSMSNMDRVAVNHSAYVPDDGGFVKTWTVAPSTYVDSSTPTLPDTPVWIQSPVPAAVPPTMVHVYAPTSTGRAARGELESQVKEACDVWRVDVADPTTWRGQPCTPSYVSEEITKKHGIKPPSVGAIDAVFKRWMKIGFAVIHPKPTRFICYTPRGIELGLEGIKAKYQRAQVKI